MFLNPVPKVATPVILLLAGPESTLCVQIGIMYVPYICVCAYVLSAHTQLFNHSSLINVFMNTYLLLSLVEELKMKTSSHYQGVNGLKRRGRR